MTAPARSATPFDAPFVGTPAAHDEIRATIGHYVDGLREGSPDILRRGFHPGATMCGYLGETPMISTAEGLYDFVASHPAPARSGEPFAVEVTAIQVAGETATADILEHSYQGFEFRTSFHLMRLDGRWQIVAKLFASLGTSPAAATP